MITKFYTKFFIGILVLCAFVISVDGATVAYWQFDGPDGKIDAVGSYTLTATGTEVFSTDTTKRLETIPNPDTTTPWLDGTAADNPSCADLTGSNVYYSPNPFATHDSTFDFDPTKSFTIEGWVVTPTVGTTGVIVGNTQANSTVYPAGNNYKGWRIASNNSTFRFYADGGVSYVEITTPVTAGEFLHFAGVWDATAYQMRLYINGELRGVAAGNPAWSFNRGGELSFGARDTGSGYTSMVLNGYIDEIRYSDTALTVEEFLYIDPSPITVAYWEFDGAAWDANDAVGEHNLTLQGSVTTSNLKVNPIPNPDTSEQWHSSSTAASNPSSTLLSPSNQSVYYYPNPLATHNGDFDFDATKSFTVEGWFSTNSASTAWLIGNRTGNTTDAYNGTWKGWDVHVGAGPTLSFYIDGASLTGFSQMITAPIVLDELTHFAAVWDAVSYQMRLYINGKLQSSASGKAEWSYSRGGPLSVGGRDAGTGYNSWLFGGRIDEVRYSRKVIDQVDFLNYPFCGVWGYKASDFNEDCYVDITDFAMLANSWLAE